MTCKDMGGPCDAVIQGETAEEMIANGAKHVVEMANEEDDAHKNVLVMMEEMKKDPESEEAKAWTEKFNADFAALPEGEATAETAETEEKA